MWKIKIKRLWNDWFWGKIQLVAECPNRHFWYCRAEIALDKSASPICKICGEEAVAKFIPRKGNRIGAGAY